MSAVEKPTDTTAFHQWGFWFNGVDVHPHPSLSSLKGEMTVVSTRDSHGELTYAVFPTADPDSAKEMAILSLNLGFHENNVSFPQTDKNFWFVLQQWLNWKETNKAQILGIRVYFTDGRIEEVGSIPK